MRLLYLAALALALALGCDDGSSEDPPAPDAGGGGGSEGRCVDDEAFFEAQVMATVLEPKCQKCHREGGQAAHSDLVLEPSASPGALQANFERVKEVAELERDGVSILLLKPSAQIGHDGGHVIDVDSSAYRTLQEMIARFEEPVVCEEPPTTNSLMAKVVPLDAAGTLRKAALHLVGRLPTAQELEEAESDLGGVLQAYMREPEFYETLKRWHNDTLLTNKYLTGNRATDLLNADDYPDRHYYREMDEETTEGAAARAHANDSVARAPLELIAHVVREGRPFSEILTADYVLVNPFSARVYGIDVNFDDDLDPTEWREGRIPGIPHAGLLTSTLFLNRFPTTDTNRNRHRARVVWKMFLATDILRLAERPLDTESQRQQHNPTMNNDACTVCHIPLDPVAGAFMNWDSRGRYRPPEEGWHGDMRPAGFSEEEPVPGEEWGRSLSWLAERIAIDERFATAAVYNAYAYLIGREPISKPTDDTDPRFDARLAFHKQERDFLAEITERFIAEGLDYRVIIEGIIESRFYRAVDVDGASSGELEVLAPMGAARLLTPEELDAKLIAITGYPWKRRGIDRNRLTHRWEFLFFYGGIDSDQITRRPGEPDGLMASVATRMAYEMGCLVPPREFARPAEERLLFPLVEATFAPEDENGFPIPAAEEAIRANIRHLHQHVLDEALEPGGALEEISWNLFLETWREGYAGVMDDALSEQLVYHCRYSRDFDTDEGLEEGKQFTHDPYYTVRAWSAVLSALLSDWRFLYRK